MKEIEPLLSPARFVALEGIAHLCTGGECPWLIDHAGVYEQFARLKSAGRDGREEIYRIGDRCRERMATLWGVPADRVAFMPSAAEGMAWLARGLDWREGDNVVTTNLEFPSVAYAWRNLRARGVEIRLVPHRDWVVAEADLLARIDARTRVLAVSHVSYYTGQRLDLERLADGVRSTGTLLAVDATHAAGVVRVPAELSDLTVSSSYKWLLATHGVAPCYLSQRAEEGLQATSFGWRNLGSFDVDVPERPDDVAERPMPERLEPGNPAMQVIMHLDKGLEVLLGIGVEPIEAHALDLAEQVTETIESLGRRVITPRRRESRSGNTCFLDDDALGLERRLTKLGVVCWGDFGRVRVSTHLYNGSEDVARLGKALREI